MNKNIIKKWPTILIAVLFCISSLISVNASEYSEKNKYAETRKQIYFDDINVSVADNSRLIFSISSKAGLFKRLSANEDIETLNAYFQKYPETEKLISSQTSKGTLYALSYTDAPLVFVDDHYERVTARNSQSESGSEHTRGYLTLCTAIFKTDEQNNLGEYLYYGITAGEWSKNSIIGGTNYPASGYDNVVQITPDTSMIRGDHEMIATYINTLTNKTEDGEEGTDFFAVPYNPAELQFFSNYMIKDDPFGLRQLSSFILTTEYFSKAPNTSRSLYSIYIHTWKDMDIDVSIEAEGSISYTPLYELDISGTLVFIINPEIADKCWALESSVTFNF